MDMCVCGQLFVAGFEELQISLLFGVVNIVLWFFLASYEYSGVEPARGVLH